MVDKAAIRKEVSWLGARLREPTTYAGLAVLLGGLLHLSHADAWTTAITSIGVGLGGVIAILLPENKS